jgi:hypothetical protein
MTLVMSLNPNVDWAGGAMNDGAKHARKDSLSNQKIITIVSGQMPVFWGTPSHCGYGQAFRSSRICL